MLIIAIIIYNEASTRRLVLTMPDHGTSPFLPTLHMMDWRSKEEKDIQLLPLVDEFVCSALPFVVKMILFVDLQGSSCLYFISTNLIYITIILSTNSEYNDHSVLNFPLQFTPNQVDSTTNLLDKVVITKVVLRPIGKPRSVRPHKSILKKCQQEEITPRKQNFRSVCKPPCGATANRKVNNSLKSSRHLLYESEDRNKYPHRNTHTLFPINWKFTKKRSRIIRDILIPDHSPHHGLSHRIELKTDSPSMIDRDTRLQYDLIKRLLFISKNIVPNIHACVSYFITRMESPFICHENDLLQLDVLSVKKLQLFILSSKEEHHLHLESLLSKHTSFPCCGQFSKNSPTLLQIVFMWRKNTACIDHYVRALLWKRWIQLYPKLSLTWTTNSGRKFDLKDQQSACLWSNGMQMLRCMCGPLWSFGFYYRDRKTSTVVE